MSDKRTSRLRRARRARAKISELGATRLSIHRTPRHIYAQIIASDGASVVASASTLDKDLRSGKTGNADAAKVQRARPADHGRRQRGKHGTRASDAQTPEARGGF